MQSVQCINLTAVSVTCASLYFLPKCIALHALHAMQSSDDKAICMSVRLSKVCIVTKWKKDLSRFLYYMKDHLA